MSKESVVPLHLTTAVAEQRIHRIAQDTSSVKLTFHAKQQMADRDISITDMYRILRTGQVETTPKLTERGNWKCKMTHALRGRRTAGVVVALTNDSKLVVITVEWEDGK